MKLSMLRDAVDQDKADVLPGSRDLHFYMGKIGITVFSLIIKRHFDLALALVPQPCRRDPFPMEEELALCRKADNVVLLQPMELPEHLVVIVSPVHDESGFSEQGGGPFHCGKSHIIDGCEVLPLRRMDLGEDADGMAVLRKGAGFCDMVAFFIDVLCVRAFGAIPDKAEGFELAAIRFHDIAVIDMADRFVRDPFADGVKV